MPTKLGYAWKTWQNSQVIEFVNKGKREKLLFVRPSIRLHVHAQVPKSYRTHMDGAIYKVRHAFF